jgi:hypothetical protein
VCGRALATQNVPIDLEIQTWYSPTFDVGLSSTDMREPIPKRMTPIRFVLDPCHTPEVECVLSDLNGEIYPSRLRRSTEGNL